MRALIRNFADDTSPAYVWFNTSLAIETSVPLSCYDGMYPAGSIRIASHPICVWAPPYSVRQRARKAQSGFTLLELLVVIAIIGLLAAYVGPKYYSQLGKSEQSVCKSQIEAFSRALGTYRLDVGNFPTTEEGLGALVTAPANATKWNGPYLDKALPVDPWGRQYLYRFPGTKGRDFDIESLGKDGQLGGIGESADITN